MKYEQIKTANDAILTTDIQGKPYAEVNQRIKAFRMCYPDGLIETEILSNENGVVIFKARAYDKAGGSLLATGHAYEKEGSTFINRTSYIENCETSAVGRCLGLCGFGIDTSVASAEEVQNAIAQQKPEDKPADKPAENPEEKPATKPASETRKASAKQVELVAKLYADRMDDLLAFYKIKSLNELPMKTASGLIQKAQAKKGE